MYEYIAIDKYARANNICNKTAEECKSCRANNMRCLKESEVEKYLNPEDKNIITVK